MVGLERTWPVRLRDVGPTLTRGIATGDEELRRSAHRVGCISRGLLLGLCIAVAVVTGATDSLLWLAFLLPLALLATRTWVHRRSTLLVMAAEGSVWGLTVLATGSETSVFLPYLLAPVVSGGLVAGVHGAVIPPAAAAFILLAGPVLQQSPPSRAFSAGVTQWVVLSSFVGLVTAWASQLTVSGGQLDSEGAQKVAFDLLSKLRTVARRLPGTLDPASTAEALLQSVRLVAPYARGAVLVRSAGAGLVPLARVGAERPDWDIALAGDSSVADAWATQEAQGRDKQLRRHDGASPAGSSLVIPLALGLRTLGLLVLETEQTRAWSAEEARSIGLQAEGVALQLETGLLFDEVRALATTEERKRVAREIHDGIAQELVFLGYTLDNLVVEAGSPEANLVESLTKLRAEVSRLVGDLRLSLFDLRADVDTNAGLGTALSDHVRAVGTQSGLTIHLVLTESAIRLPAATEVELLRMAQEAVANVRKHAQASNLWVTCVVEPPHACIVVEDDGIGMMAKARADSYGLTIMRERAERLQARLIFQPGNHGGTRVEVHLGSVAPDQEPRKDGEQEARRDAHDSSPRR